MSNPVLSKELLIPPHFDPYKTAEIWRVPYQELAEQATDWANRYNIQPSGSDTFRIALIIIDVQITFCIPGFELFVAGRSGSGALDDTRRLCNFIYRNLGMLTQITATMDTHETVQIFHPIFLVNEQGAHPAPYTLVSVEDIQQGRWRFNPAVAKSLGISEEYGERQLLHYVEELKRRGKYEHTIWPYHGMLGGIGHALVPSLEEAIFFHSIARSSQADIQIKGQNPFTENYSAIGPEVLDDPDGRLLAQKNETFLQKVIDYDMVIIAGQAKSHCLGWTVADLLTDIRAREASLASKVYLLEDTTSAVVVPGAIDYTDAANQAFQRFKEAGMHLVQSTDPIANWSVL
jgi:nicotinamidase-related amidase